MPRAQLLLHALEDWCHVPETEASRNNRARAYPGGVSRRHDVLHALVERAQHQQAADSRVALLRVR
jgi:hypothetical protein